MAGTLYYTTYAKLPEDIRGHPIPVPDLSAILDTGTITSVSTTSQASAALNTTAKFVQFKADGGKMNVFAGSGTPVALATHPLLSDGETAFYGITGGHAIAVRNPA